MPSLTLRHPARWLLITALAIHLPIAIRSAVRSGQPMYDFERYYDIATNPTRPYRDFPVEYPPGTVVTLRGLAAATGSRGAFGVAVVAVSVVADVAIVAALAWGWGINAAACYALVIIPIVDLFYLRTDLWSAAAVTLAVAAWQRRREALSAAALAAGVALKLWPLPFFALFFVRVRGRTHVTAALVAGAAVVIGWIWIAGWSGVYQVLTFRGARGWQIESVIGSVMHLVGSESLRMESGSWRIGATSGPVSVLMFLLAAPLCVWSVWRGARTAHLGTGWLAGVSALLLLSALLSAQFVGWLAPGSAIAWTEGDRRSALMAAATIALTEVFWNWYDAVLSGAMPALVAVVARNVVLGALLVVALRTLARTLGPVRE